MTLITFISQSSLVFVASLLVSTVSVAATKKLCAEPVAFEPSDAKLAFEQSTNPRDTDSHLNLALRMRKVMLQSAQKEINTRTKKHHDTYWYGNGANPPSDIGSLRRGFQAKSHGCVKAKFTPLFNLTEVPGVGPDAGVFNPLVAPDGFDAYIRFSNARGEINSDTVNDLKGFAMRLYRVAGERIRSSTGIRATDTQDFLFTNAPFHFAKTAAELVRFAEFVAAPSSIAKKALRPKDWKRIKELLANGARASRDIRKNETDSVLRTDYYSRTPFAVGKRAAKFWIAPVDCELGHRLPKGMPLKINQRTSGNHFHEDLVAKLGAKDQCFDFYVQFQVDPWRQCVEEADVPWLESEAPSLAVGRITIPTQTFSSPDQIEACDEMSFNPWNGLVAHLPLGEMNRARQQVYYQSSKARRP